MPTGYTSPVVDGTISTFPAFALQCARAFGACILMRDDPMDAPIPDEFTPSDYHDKALATAVEKQNAWRTMTDDQREEWAEQFRRDTLAERRKALETAEHENALLESMLGFVQAWTPPTPDHQGLKEFMAEQLRISMNDLSWDFYDLSQFSPERFNPLAATNEHTKSLAWSVDYHEREARKEVERTAERNAWVRHLRESLNPTPSESK